MCAALRRLGRLVMLTAVFGTALSLPPEPLSASSGFCAGSLAERHDSELRGLTRAGSDVARVEAEIAGLEDRFRRVAGVLSLFAAGELGAAPLAPLSRAREILRLRVFLLELGMAPRVVFREASFAGWDLSAVPSCTLPGGSFRPPLLTAFGSRFGVRVDPFTGRPRHHAGLDFGAPAGTPVAATADGVVTRAERSAGGYGQLVEVDHGHGVRTRYAHLSQISVRLGDTVRAGDEVGLVGSTGRSTAPHLHFEVRVDGVAVDPVPWL